MKELELSPSEAPLIMLSVNIDEDPHFRRIKVDDDKCTKCQLCIPSCPSQAFNEINIFSYEADLCFGCSNCLEYCPYEALDFENWSAYDATELNRLFTLGADAFEIHLSNNLEALSDFYQQLNLERILLESFSIGSERMTEAELAKAALFIIEMVSKREDFPKRSIIIQCDGIPQSGARIADADKDLKSIQNAALVIKTLNQAQLKYPNVFVQIAGGINDKSLEKARALGVEIDGIAIGSWLRKRILDLDLNAAKQLSAEILKKSRSFSVQN